MVEDLRPNPNNAQVSYGDGATSKVLGLGKVIITPDLSIGDVMLVETLSYNLLSVRQLAIMGFATFFDIDIVTLLWRKSLTVAFVGYVENGLFVVDFSKKPTMDATCLMA
jgi:hypothetical protein